MNVGLCSRRCRELSKSKSKYVSDIQKKIVEIKILGRDLYNVVVKHVVVIHVVVIHAVVIHAVVIHVVVIHVVVKYGMEKYGGTYRA